ncbi:hypothetical protein CMV_009815 [Castanea mollissima]|uniref:Aminotransferase-like plant mobile domain-containing protein n=1 Tax=Castanea mollissima TaxID=60419 RepID=A0A8J4RK26_9ROSI|nr:hypothetical protein CMV_009815 [Castanea mollissima]
MDDPSDSIVEIREELMVSSTGGNPTLRIAHFLTPTIKGPDFNLPPVSSSSLPPYFEPQKLPLRVSFWGWRYPQNIWNTWVEKMASLHQATWKKAGIYEAVLNSTYQIRRDNDLVFGFGERWCSETNTFIFRWGEATITLEDIMVLGGYSVLGDSVFCPVESEEQKEIENSLKEARREIGRTKAKKACQFKWLKKFMDSGSEFEHEAFLSCWLSRYVLQNSSQTIRECAFSIAIHLARGRKIALAPTVLASIYRDLSLFKEKIIASAKSVPFRDDEDGVLELSIVSPFHLVQIWVWERFLELRPNPNVIYNGDSIMAKWDKVNGSKIASVRSALDSCGESFLWRPYARAVNDCNFPKFYAAEKEKYISVGPGLDEELQSFARCLRVSELVGLGCIEQYLPHRVAMQFGMDQDLPDCVARINETPKIAWNHYSTPIHKMELYVPSRHFKGYVTVRYLEWWKQSIISQKDAIIGAVQQGEGKKGTDNAYIPSKSSKNPHKKVKGKKKSDDLHVTPGFSSRFGVGNCNGEAGNSFSHFECLSSSSSDSGPVRKLGKKDVAKGVVECQRDSNSSKGRIIGNDASVAPGFPPKCNRVDAGDSDEEDELTLKQLLRSCNTNNGVGNRMSGNGKPLSSAKSHVLSSSTADKGKVGKIKSLMDPVVKIMHGEAVMGNARHSIEVTNKSKVGSEEFSMESINVIDGERSGSCTFDHKTGLELEARISKLEKLVAELKAARFGYKFEKKSTKEGLSRP